MKFTSLVFGAALLSTITFTGVASAQTTPGPMMQGQGMMEGHGMMRSEHGSDRNLRMARRHLEHMIDQLEHDRHDYGGHRAAAITHLKAANDELEEALEYDKAHPEK